GTQSYTDVITVSGNTTLTTTNAAVGFSTTVDGTVAATQGLTVAAGTSTVSCGGGVGTSFSLASLTVTGTGGITLRTVTTSGLQSYTGAVTLGATATLTGTVPTFSSTVSGAN